MYSYIRYLKAKMPPYICSMPSKTPVTKPFIRQKEEKRTGILKLALASPLKRRGLPFREEVGCSQIYSY
jgi:hypothetical protein